MTRRKIEEKNIRKIFKSGSSYAVTIPLEIVKNLKIKKSQKVVVEQREPSSAKASAGQWRIIIEDWPASAKASAGKKK